MVLQLNLFGLWEQVQEDDLAQETLPPFDLPPEPPPVPVLPGQISLLEGAHGLLARAEEAVLALDPGALRVAWDDWRHLRPESDAADSWPRWADALDRLMSSGGREAAVAALSLLDEEQARGVFAGMHLTLLVRLRRILLCRAHSLMVQQDGPGTTLPDGRPVGWLLLAASEHALAADSFTCAMAAGAPRWPNLAGLALAQWRAGEHNAGLDCWMRLLLEAPFHVAEDDLDGTPLVDMLDDADDMELPGDPRCWVAVLADLKGVAYLPMDLCSKNLNADTISGRCAMLLLRLRQMGGSSTGSERPSMKRELVKLAPPLRGLVRRI